MDLPTEQHHPHQCDEAENWALVNAAIRKRGTEKTTGVKRFA